MMRPETLQVVLDVLDEMYPFSGHCFLKYETPWQLLFATILSAQCTDSLVNKTTAVLFEELPDLEAFVSADLSKIGALVHPTGFHRAKARFLQGCAALLLGEHGGDVPGDMEALMKLPGVGRKTANVVRSYIFQIPSITVDTHVLRVSNRMGIIKEARPDRAEFALMEILPKSRWIAYNPQIISHGRAVCRARKPLCDFCRLRRECGRI